MTAIELTSKETTRGGQPSLVETSTHLSALAVEAALPAAVRRKRRQKRLAMLHPRFWLPFGVVLVVLGWGWNIGADKMPYLLPPLGDVFGAIKDEPQYFLENAWVTLREALIGLAIGFGVACVLAVVISESGIARRAIMPVAVVLNVTPLVAIAPALVVAFGFGAAPKLILTSLICFFPILINAAVGLSSVDRQVLQVFQTVNASRWEVLRHIRIPSSLPYVFASLQIVFPLSVVGAVVAELSAAGSAAGLGTTIQVATSMNNMAMVWAAIFVLAVMGSLLLLFVTAVERKILHWHESKQ
ncbi:MULTISPECIES: ABC transporter permease [Aeromicrobium]|uniref:ABC transporter permease subunit n=1 Tax=Aeromicrobium yanjiei TaxID=2662028 RepID=A0A5Q2MD46_9ACTN|nr:MULTISPECIES: ABC transporter permease [Aeromicrobium]MRK02246.1 ABC transporter permease subunit [Aeromicrobium sp. S22]QGG41034.1 ABC transporter permease subunit [Aeromicrobium yanjiei]